MAQEKRVLVTRNPFTGEDHVFELVDFVPLGYSIWNIGENMEDGYLPFCRQNYFQPFPGGRSVETETLKAIKCDGAQTILAAIGYGPETPEEMEKFIEKHKKAKLGGLHYEAVKRMKNALPLMRKIKWK